MGWFFYYLFNTSYFKYVHLFMKILGPLWIEGLWALASESVCLICGLEGNLV